MIRHNILVVDDEEHILDVVKSYLEANGYNTYSAKNGKEALGIIQKKQLSLILLDLMLPDFRGEEICKTVRLSSKIPIIMLTAKVDEASIINGLKIGADDYVTKPFSPKQLMARVEAALRRSGYNPETAKILHSGDLTIDIESRDVFLYHENETKKINFTKEEFEILHLLMNRSEKIYTRDEIFERVKNDDSDAFDRVIDAQIKNIRAKLQDDAKNPRYIATVYGIGYRFAGLVT
ncbi:DNA-binding response regulator [Spirochaetia bacterium]|nr:DNA-binding response regulator [Spirochaetia bacterium]